MSDAFTIDIAVEKCCTEISAANTFNNYDAVQKVFSSKPKAKPTSFDLEKFLLGNKGKKWLDTVKVKDSNDKAFSYYAPRVAWEDIHRNQGSATGDFIFDVTMNIKGGDSSKSVSSSKSKTVRYILRPENMKDPISVQSTQAINVPVGNFKGDPLSNVKLIDVLSDQKKLNDLGVDCRLNSSLYEPLVDEPAHLLPDIHCICGVKMQRVQAKDAYSGTEVWCDGCTTKYDTTTIEGAAYHCPKGRCDAHQNGWDLCEQCAGLQIRSFFERKEEEKKQDSLNGSAAAKGKEAKWGKGGMMLSVGCGLLSEEDMGKSYEIEVYLYPSSRYRDGKCLCIITTAEGTTANMIEPGKREKLQFAKNGKECDWGIERFDTSTEEGRINERTGKSAETDMVIYFVPVQEDKPQHKPKRARRHRRWHDDSGTEDESDEEDSDGDDDWGNFDVEEEADAFSSMPYSQPQQQSQPQSDIFGSLSIPAAIHPTAKTFSSSQSHSDLLTFSSMPPPPPQQSQSCAFSSQPSELFGCSSSFGGSSMNSGFGGSSMMSGFYEESKGMSGLYEKSRGSSSYMGSAKKRKGKKKAKKRVMKPRGKRIKGRGARGGNDDDAEEVVEPELALKFAKHKMTVSDRSFALRGRGLRYPLKRIRDLPIRAFVRGAVFFDQTKPPDSSDALRLSQYLQSRYNDTELLSIHSFSVLIKQRAKLLPVSEQYYRDLHSFKKREGGVYDLHFTEHAKKEKELCVVCMDECINMVMVDCHHMCLCTHCATKWTMSCPICRAKVRTIVPEDTLDKNKVRIIPMAVSG